MSADTVAARLARRTESSKRGFRKEDSESALEDSGNLHRTAPSITGRTRTHTQQHRSTRNSKVSDVSNGLSSSP